MTKGEGSACGKLKQPHVMPEAVLACGDWNGGAGILKGWLAGPRKQRQNPSNLAAH